MVARQMGKVCVCGASALQIDYGAKTMVVDGAFIRGRIDFDQRHGGRGLSRGNQNGGVRGRPGVGEKSLKPSESVTNQMFKKLMDWCKQSDRLQVRTNAAHRSSCHAVALGRRGSACAAPTHVL